jgi:plastocyanin
MGSRLLHCFFPFSLIESLTIQLHQKIKKRARLNLSRLFLLFLFSVTSLFITPSASEAIPGYVEVDAYPGPGFNPGDVTINVGESVHWQHVDISGGSAPHWIQAGDYQGRPCYDSTFATELNGEASLLITHEEYYLHFFPAPGGNCYYRCIFFPPDSGGPGMQGVVRVIPVGGSTTTTTTTTRPVTTTTTTRPGTTTTTTTLPNQPPSLNSLTPVNISTQPSVVQSFTAGYSDPNG